MSDYSNGKGIDTSGFDGIDNLIKEAFLLLEAGEWSSAVVYCDGVLEDDPYNAKVYLCKLMAHLHCKRREDLKELDRPFDEEPLYKKLVELASIELKAELKADLLAIKARNIRKAEEEKAERKKVLPKRIARAVGVAVALVAAVILMVFLMNGGKGNNNDDPNYDDPNGNETESLYFTVGKDGTVAWDRNRIDDIPEELEIPEEINGVVITEITSQAFYGCKNLKSVVIPSSVKYIGRGVFDGCTSLESITVADGNLIYHSVDNCVIESSVGKLIVGCKNSVIPTDGSIEIISAGAFSGCTELKSIEIPLSVTRIGDYAFSGCTGLASIEIPAGVTEIGNSVFSNCIGLKSIYIPSGVKSIGNSAFAGCTGLTSLNMPTPSALTTIGDSAINSERDFRKTQQKTPNNIENSLQMIA